MYAQESAQINAAYMVESDYRYTCGCDILLEELGVCDEQKLLKK